jgi:hypothetical protein
VVNRHGALAEISREADGALHLTCADIVEPGDREARSPDQDGGPFSQRDR